MARDGCAVEGPLGALLSEWAKRWEADRPETQLERDESGRIRRARPWSPLPALEWLSEQTRLSVDVLKRVRGLPERTESGRRTQVEWRVADAIVTSIGLTHAFHDGVLRVVVSRAAPVELRLACRRELGPCCGGSARVATVSSARGRTIPEISVRTGFDQGVLFTVLEDERRRGRVRVSAGVYSLTASGEEAYAPLRDLRSLNGSGATPA